MSFLLPALLFTGLLTLVVLVLHTTQRRTITVASTQLWRQIQRQATQRRRVWRLPKLSILLVLQLLAVIAAALALAQPLWGPRSAPEHLVLVLDGSASMQSRNGAQSRFEEAREALAQRLGEVEPHIAPHVSVVLASARPALVAGRQTEASDALEARVAALRPVEAPADWATTRQLIAQVVREGEPTRVVVYTDGTDAGVSTLQGLGEDVAAEELRFGSVQPGAMLTATLEASPSRQREYVLEGTVTLSDGLAEVSMIVEFLGENATTPLQWLTQTFHAGVAAGAPVPAEPVRRGFKETLQLPGPGIVRVRLDDAATPFDNIVNFVVGAPNAAFQVLYVGPRDPVVLRALQSIEGAAVFEADGLPADLSQFNLVVIDSVEVDRFPETNALWIGSARLSGDPLPEELAGQDFTNWQDAHPLSFGVDWGAVIFDKGYAVAPAPGAEVLVQASGNPMVEARTIPPGREVRFAFRPSESNWGEEPSFPLFISNMIEWLGPRDANAVRPDCVVGLPCTLDARYLGAGFQVTDAWISGPDQAPSGPVALFDADDGRLIAQRPGVYRIASEARSEVLAVNTPVSNESVHVTQPQVLGDAAAQPALIRLAPWLLGALLLILLVEGWIAGRGPERFLRRAGLSRRNPRAPARRALLGLRLATLVLVGLALAGVPLLWPEARQNVALVAVGNDPAVARLGDEVGGDRKGAVVTASLTPHVVSDLSNARPVAGGAETRFVNVEAGVRLAAALLPAGEPGRVVLSAPQRAGMGAFADAIPSLRVAGTPIDVIPAVAANDAADLAVSRLSVPGTLYVGDAFDLSGLVYSPTEQPVVLTVHENGAELARHEVSLLPGFNWVDTRIKEARRGATLYEMEVSGDGDSVAENNRAGLQVEVDATPRVLVLSPQQQQGQLFADLLASQGFEASLLTPNRAFFKLEEWLAYDNIVLMNVPALDLQTRQQEMIEQAVSLHGRGLFIMGGENTFGPGGYFGTPLETLSPLSSRVPRESPEAALVFVLDRSGSMSQAVGNVDRLAIAKEATRAAVGLLNTQSRVSIIVFDSEAHVVLPMTESVDPEQVERALQSFDSGGGTAIYPGLEEAIRQLQGVDAPARHIIVMTDGLTQRGDFQTLLNRAREQNITVSGVAIGRGADITSVKEIATLGGGSFHTSVDFQALPSILSQEAMLLSGTPIETGATVPRWTAGRQEAFLSALPDTLPAISGFVLTTAKPDAELAITTADQEGEQMPLLASWRYGNGRVMAFTTQAAGGWSERWVDMPEYPRMLAEVMRAFLPSTESPGVTLTALRRGDEVLVRVSVLDVVGAPIAGLEFEATARVMGEGDDTETLPFRLLETAAGRYEGSFPAAGGGVYEIATRSGEHEALRQLYVDYPASLDPGAPRQSFELLAGATGGRVLAPTDRLFTDVPLQLAALPGWPLWTALALALFMIDLFIRYGNPLAGWFSFGRRSRAGAPVSGGSSTPSTNTLANQNA